MSSTNPDRIVCPACGRSGPYRPELAGKRLKCKCGSTIEVPSQSLAPSQTASESEEPLRPQPVQPAPAADNLDDDLYDVREPDDAPKRNIARPADVISYRAGEAPAEPAPDPAAYPNFARPKTYSRNVAEEQSHLIRMVVLVAAITILVAGSIFGIRFLKGSSAGPQLGEDAAVQAKLDDEYHKEVHAWFQEDSTRILGPWSQSQALANADRWQQDGAKQVIVFGSRMSTVAVIELPDDPAKRKTLFDWQAQWHRAHMTKVWTDVGQKYLMIQLGI